MSGEPLLFRVRYRSKLEERVAAQLHDAGVSFEYEPRERVVSYAVPARKAKYLPDFVTGTTIIETKGWFKAADRKKLALIKEQYPELDLRLVFQNAKNKIYKGSPTTYAQWATDHGFEWADKGIVPDSWLEEMTQCRQSQPTSSSSRKRKRS